MELEAAIRGTESSHARARPSRASRGAVNPLLSFFAFDFTHRRELLPDGREALAERLALADAAQRSLDVQYFIWNKDMAGKVLLEHLFRAADRSVRVRLLLDDLGTAPSDAALLAIDSHPNDLAFLGEIAQLKVRGTRSISPSVLELERQPPCVAHKLQVPKQ